MIAQSAHHQQSSVITHDSQSSHKFCQIQEIKLHKKSKILARLRKAGDLIGELFFRSHRSAK